jgi:energy-coupling factor transport system ATP-binding protein
VKIHIRKLNFSYPTGVKAIDNVSLEINGGEIIALVGENGAGKSTLVKHLNGLLRADGGDVRVGDWDVADFSSAQIAERVSFLFQNPDEQLFERTVWREVAFGPHNLGLSDDELKGRVDAALARVGLSEQAESHPYDLQYTDRKLVALAATLAMDAPILVLDEPTVGQDAAQRAAIGTILDELHAEGRTVILISHDLDFCAAHAERVIVMADGRILLDGSAETVLSQSEELSRAAVIPPQLVRLAQALNMPNAPLHVDEFIHKYSKWKASK